MNDPRCPIYHFSVYKIFDLTMQRRSEVTLNFGVGSCDSILETVSELNDHTKTHHATLFISYYAYHMFDG